MNTKEEQKEQKTVIALSGIMFYMQKFFAIRCI